MRGVVRSFGTAVLGAFAVPVAGISGIAALGMFVNLIAVRGSRSFGAWMFFAAACGICYAAVKTLYSIAKQGRLLVEEINKKESLSLNPVNMLGHPSPAFLVFDKANRKIAICNSVTGTYQIHEFLYVLQWHYEWGTGVRTSVTGHQEYKKSFVLVLEVADENSPILRFPMQRESSAKRWCSVLGAIFNG